MTAFMQVTGQLVFEYQAHKTVWVATTVVPVDASGNSLAGDTEAEQEAVYTSIDAVIMGTNRNNPEGWPLLFGPTSFGCAGSDCDAAVATAVLLSVPSSAISASKVGDTWTISYKNGDVAQFEVIAKSPVFTLKWNGYAINSKKQRLNRDGSIMDNQNNGGNGSGVINASATPSNPNWSWSLTQGDQCTLTAVAGDPDIGFYTAVIFVPC
jgi:hypothetical protein